MQSNLAKRYGRYLDWLKLGVTLGSWIKSQGRGDRNSSEAGLIVPRRLVVVRSGLFAEISPIGDKINPGGRSN